MITPLPFGGGVGGGAAIFLPPVCSVHLCSSVRNRTPSLDKISLMQVAGEGFLSTWGGFSLTERTEFTEPFGAHFEPQNAFGIQRTQRPFN